MNDPPAQVLRRPYNKMNNESGSRTSVRHDGAASSTEISRVFKALADPTRRAVVERLAKGSASTTELAGPFDMALPSFAQHLAMLEECGLVRSHKQGRVRLFQLVPHPLLNAEGWFSAQQAAWRRHPAPPEDSGQTRGMVPYLEVQ